MNVTSEKQIQELKDRVTATAVELFARRSVDNVSVQEICKASGITKPTFYKYLSSKETLLLHYYRHALEEMEKAWDDCSESSDYVGQILYIVRVTVQTEEKNDQICWLNTSSTLSNGLKPLNGTTLHPGKRWSLPLNRHRIRIRLPIPAIPN